jgi:hypothetical protein
VGLGELVPPDFSRLDFGIRAKGLLRLALALGCAPKVEGRRSGEEVGGGDGERSCLILVGFKADSAVLEGGEGRDARLWDVV